MRKYNIRILFLPGMGITRMRDEPRRLDYLPAAVFIVFLLKVFTAVSSNISAAQNRLSKLFKIDFAFSLKQPGVLSGGYKVFIRFYFIINGSAIACFRRVPLKVGEGEAARIHFWEWLRLCFMIFACVSAIDM